MDYTHPLPLSSLNSRLKPIFETLNLGLSVRLERLPHSGVSSLLQYLISNPEISQKLTPRKLVYLHPDNLASLTTANLLREILKQSTGKIEFINDEYILLTKLKSHNLSPLTIIIDWSIHWEQLTTAKFVLKSLYESGINFLSITPPNHYFALLPLPEKTFNFDLFTKQEIEYSIRRFLLLYNQKLTTNQINEITNKSSGLAGLIKPLIEITLTKKDILTHPKIQVILSDLQKYQNQIPQKSYLTHLLNIYSPPEKLGNLNFISSLSHQDILLIQKFQSQPNQILSRDQIAQVIWGKLVDQKYSDWAIDKAISRLRHKLSPSSNSKIITVKHSGYKLVSF